MKILLADDDPVLRCLMRELLNKEFGCEVIETTDGLQAWKVLSSGLTPDLCIFDVLMPELDGLDLLSKMRWDQRLWRQKVVLCSSAGDRARVAQAGSLEVAGYLVKPFSAEDFLALVKKVCGVGQASSVPPPLEPVETVLKRLGISRDLYLGLVNAFTSDVRDILSKFAEWPAKVNRRELELRLVSARGAGLSLGAQPAVAAIRKLESAFMSRNDSLLPACLEDLRQENDRVIAAAGGTVEPNAPPEEVNSEEAGAALPDLEPAEAVQA